MQYIWNLFRMGLFGAAHGWESCQKSLPHFLKSVTHILQWWNLAQLYQKEEPKEEPKNI